jgi:MFS family permease
MTSVTKELGHDDHCTIHGGDSQDEAIVGHIKVRLFTPDFVLATLANFINAIGLQILNATLPVYVINLGGSQAEAGLVIGTIAIIAFLFRPLVGWLTDAWQRRPVVLIGTFCFGLASVVYLLASSIQFLLLGRFFHGLGTCCYTTAANAYVADIAPPMRRAEAMGFFSAAQSLGLIIGPVIGFIIVGSTGFQYLFYFTGGLSFAAVLISIFTRERRHSESIKVKRWSPSTSIVAIDALPMAWMALCVGLGFGVVNAFISIYAQPRGLPNPGVYFMVEAIAMVLSRIFLGRLADRHGRASAIIPGMIITAMALVILPLANGLSLFVVSASLFGIGIGTAQPATMALLIDRVKPEQRGLSTNTYFMGWDVGFFIGSSLMGVVTQYWGFGVMWPMAAACIMFGLVGLLADRNR